mgnify:CR=1 FL=1
MQANKTNNIRIGGFTLAEAMMATLILGIAAAGVLLPFTSGTAARAEGSRRTLASKLACDLMEQIVTTPFDQIVSTYNGYGESQGQVRDFGGSVFTDPAYAGFSRDASCQYVYTTQESGSAEPIFIRVSVRVYYNGKEVVALHRLVGE